MRMNLKKITTATYIVDGVAYEDKNVAKIALVKSELRSMFQQFVNDEDDLEAVVQKVLMNNKAIFNLMLTYKKHSAAAVAEASSDVDDSGVVDDGETEREAA